MMSVTPAGRQRTRAVPPVSVPALSRFQSRERARVVVAVLSRMWRAGSVSLLLGAAALVWLIATLLSPPTSTQAFVALSPTTAAVQTVANIRLVPADVAGSPGGASGGDSAAPAPKPASSSKSSNSGSGGSSSSGGSNSSSSGDSSDGAKAAGSPKPADSSPSSSSSSSDSAAAKPAAAPKPAEPAANSSPADAGAPKPAQPATNTDTATQNAATPKPAPPAASPTNATTAPEITGAPKPAKPTPDAPTQTTCGTTGGPCGSAPKTVPVTDSSAAPPITGTPNPAKLDAHAANGAATPTRDPDGSPGSCGPGCPAPPPATPAAPGSGAPTGPSNAAGGGTGAAGHAGGPGAGRLDASVGSVDSNAAQLLAGGLRQKLLDPNQSPGAARGPPPPASTAAPTDPSQADPNAVNPLLPRRALPAGQSATAPSTDPLEGSAGLTKVPAQPDPGNGLSPPAAAFNARVDQKIKAFQDQTGIPMDKIGIPFEPSRRVALGLVDGALNAGYEGTTVAANPQAAAQASSSRWSSLLHGNPNALADDYWNHPGTALAQDTNTLKSNTLGRAASATATQLIPGASTIMSSPVAAAWIGDTAGGMAHTALNVGKRYVPALAYTAANIATGGAASAATKALGIDPYAQIKTDYKRDWAGALTEDVSAAMMFIPGLGEAGAAGTAARATGTARAATTAETAAATDAAAAAAATKAAAGEANAATPQAAIPHELPKPLAQKPEPAGTRSESGPLTTGSGVRDPTPTATAPRSGSVAAGPVGRRPAGKAAARPGGASDSDPTGAAGTRPGRPAGIVGGRLGGADGSAPVAAGGGDPLVATGAGNRPAAGRAQSPTASTPKLPRDADEARQDTGRAEDISGPSIARDIGPVEGGGGGTWPLGRSPEYPGTTPADGGPTTARSGTGLERSDVDSLPNGFSSKNEFAEFGNQLHSGLAKAGYGETTPAFQGSSVTGRSFRTGERFDEGRRSDFDIALGGEDIMRAAELEGVKLRSKGTRTGPLTSGQLRRLGLNDMARDLSSRAGRDVNFMIYRSVDEAIRHKPSIAVPR